MLKPIRFEELKGGTSFSLTSVTIFQLLLIIFLRKTRLPKTCPITSERINCRFPLGSAVQTICTLSNRKYHFQTSHHFARIRPFIAIFPLKIRTGNLIQEMCQRSAA